jgi:hypothetical protein
MASIDTLIKDIYDVVDGKGGWDEAVSEFYKNDAAAILDRRLRPDDKEYSGLRMSSLGQPCRRKLWYQVNEPDKGEPLDARTKLKFLYGDMLEHLLISLAMAAGHRVEGQQTRLDIAGVKGHRDCVIDGITVDVKSASGYGFRKFKAGLRKEDDAFGYLFQLSSYVYAGRSDYTESHPTKGAFLVINKETGEICLDEHDFDLKGREDEVLQIIKSTTGPAPGRLSDAPDGTSGNRVLGTNCSYCQFKLDCWPNLRTFLYKQGDRFKPVFFTKVVKEPKVMEAK